jgi:hypothetical protein
MDVVGRVNFHCRESNSGLFSDGAVSAQISEPFIATGKIVMSNNVCFVMTLGSLMLNVLHAEE